jgi:SAM-dependent methyltransferase
MNYTALQMLKEEAIDGRISPSVRKLWERFYPNYVKDQFAELLQKNIRRNYCVLEIGAGSGKGNQHHFELRGKVARYIGIDPDQSILENEFLDEAHVGFAESLPFADGSFDVAFHYNVAEHFETPLACNREIARVIKSGGLLLFQTPSRFYYPMMAAQFTPHWFHEFYINRFGSGRTAQEVFPTYYRLNDEKSIIRHLCSCGFKCEIQHHSTPPGYLRFSRLSFLAGVLIERTLEKRIPALRARLIVVAQKAA